MSAPKPESQPDGDAAAAPTAASLVGRQVGKYRVQRLLGRGGMGAVYEAIHEALGQRIAIKVLNAELSANTRHVQRFFDEARTVNIVQHPGLIKAYDFGHLPDGTTYITMEYLEGETLQERLARLHGQKQRMDLIDALRIGRQIASALEAVHEKGIAHRDLKPANLFLVPDKESPSGERAKILDFGIAKFYDSTKLNDAPGGSQEHQLTTVGKLLGTPAYMSPEQCSGADNVDDSIDVYSLGVILYQMLAGRLPFEGQVAVLIMTKHITEPPPPLSPEELGLPPPLCELVHQMLAKDRKGRPTMAQVVVRLEQLLEAETGASSHQWRSQHRRRWPTRRRWPYYVLGVSIVLASVALIQIGKQRRIERRSRAVAAGPVQEAPRPGLTAKPAAPPAVDHATPPAPRPGDAVPAVGTQAAPPAPRESAAPPVGPAPTVAAARPVAGPKRKHGAAKASGRDGGHATAPAPPAVEVPILR